MALSCAQHTAYVFDRGGRRKVAQFGPLLKVKWGRLRDDISVATAVVGVPSAACSRALGIIEAGRHELVIFRGTDRVWEGPITRITYTGTKVEIEAKDVMHYVNRTIMRREYDNRYPNNSTALARIRRIMTAEMARKEALDPPINTLAHVKYLFADTAAGERDAGTAARTLPYEMTVFEHIDNYAQRGGVDYTVVGRSILFFDVRKRIGQTPMVTADDFLGDPVITQYGMELATYVAHSDGKGHFGEAGGTDPYYGQWEVLFQAYDEDAERDGDEPPSVEELRSQAERTHRQSYRPPLVVRIPDNTSLNPDGVLRIEDLVPGVHIPMRAALPGRTVSQMQKLDSMTVTEDAQNGEKISVVMSPAPSNDYAEEDEE